MEEYSFALDSESQPVVGVENFSIARDVIKSLRSSSNSNRHYQHNATRDNFLIDNLDEFNKVVVTKAAAAFVAQTQEDKLNQSITNFKPPIRYIVPKHTNTNNGTFLYNATGPALSSKSYDDFSSDDEQQPSPSKLAKSPKYDDEDEFDLKGDSSDDDDSWNSKPQKKHLSPPQHSSQNSTIRTSKNISNRKNKTGDDDLDFGEDDDEADNAELFARFTAPVSNSSKGKSGTSAFNATTDTMNRSGKFANSSINSVSGTVNGKTAFGTSSGKGSAGIRGIQELLKEPNAYGSRNTNSTASAAAAATSNASLLSGIKPGQAIRVKAPGKRRNLQTVAGGEKY